MQSSSPPSAGAHRPVRGRGALENPQVRFEHLGTEIEPDAESPERLPTEYYKDSSRSIISTNDSPDIGFDASFNAYRGCEHGCIYCYARPTHEYLGMSCGLDFETKLLVKTDAPELLRKSLNAPSWKPQTLVMSGVTDPYQPAEKKFKITRGCLEALLEFRNPVTIITKNHLVTRDIDILSEMAKYNLARVMVSITTLDKKLARVMEPRASAPSMRLKAIEQLRVAGVSAGVMMAPIIPGLTDHEIPALLKAAKNAGAQGAGHTIVRLPYGVKDLFQSWLEEHYPLRKQKVLNRIREMRGGKLYNAEFGSRMTGTGVYADQINQFFEQTCHALGLDQPMPKLAKHHFRRVTPQLSLF